MWFVIHYLHGIVMIAAVTFARSTFKIIRKEDFVNDLHEQVPDYLSKPRSIGY